jgi:hypothetical protein
LDDLETTLGGTFDSLNTGAGGNFENLEISSIPEPPSPAVLLGSLDALLIRRRN